MGRGGVEAFVFSKHSETKQSQLPQREQSLIQYCKVTNLKN